MPELDKEASHDNKRLVYLVTFPHPKNDHTEEGVPLVAPETLSKDTVLKALLDSCTHPVSKRTWQVHGPVAVDKVGVWREFHEENEEGKTVTTRWLQTRIGQNYIAKDRSGKLDGFESPDLASVINKLGFAGGAA